MCGVQSFQFAFTIALRFRWVALYVYMCVYVVPFSSNQRKSYDNGARASIRRRRRKVAENSFDVWHKINIFRLFPVSLAAWYICIVLGFFGWFVFVDQRHFELLTVLEIIIKPWRHRTTQNSTIFNSQLTFNCRCSCFFCCWTPQNSIPPLSLVDCFEYFNHFFALVKLDARCIKVFPISFRRVYSDFGCIFIPYSVDNFILHFTLK